MSLKESHISESARTQKINGAKAALTLQRGRGRLAFWPIGDAFERAGQEKHPVIARDRATGP